MTHPLTKFREKTGLSMDQVAKAASTSRQTIHRIENWGQSPSLALVARLIAASDNRLRADDFMPSTDAPSVSETPSRDEAAPNA
jgi:DNA-binding XRE family transcriptional regulator